MNLLAACCADWQSYYNDSNQKDKSCPAGTVPISTNVMLSRRTVFYDTKSSGEKNTTLKSPEQLRLPFDLSTVNGNSLGLMAFQMHVHSDFHIFLFQVSADMRILYTEIYNLFGFASSVRLCSGCYTRTASKILVFPCALSPYKILVPLSN